jgi:hypothetical protein
MLSGKKASRNKHTTSIQYATKDFISIAVGLILTSISMMSVLSSVDLAYGQDELSVQENVDTSNFTSGSMDEDSAVAFKSNLEQIAGHLNAALMNKDSGNDTLALAHAFHPVAEVYTIIEPIIANTNSTLNQTLSADLSNITDMVRFVSAAEFSGAVMDAKQLLNETSDAVVPSQLRDNVTFNIRVAIDLLNTAVAEYEEAISNNSIAQIVEYQDAQAFIARGIDRAESIFEQESAEIPQNMTESVVAEVKAMFLDLDNQILSIASPETVASTIQGITDELSKVAGITEPGVEANSPSILISNIRDLLDQAITAYSNQNYSQAESLAIEAYLENYEYIEAPLADLDNSLMEDIEVMLREELRQQIQNRVPLQEIQQQIVTINNNLNDAENLLAGDAS